MKVIHKTRFIAFQNECILVLEKLGDKKRYSLAGGVVKKGETDAKSLIREVKEEIGITLKKDDVNYFITLKSKNKEKNQVYKHYFIATQCIKDIALLEPEKFKSVAWIPLHQALAFLDKEDHNAITLYCN
mgnify:CR=1 FL=1